LTGDILLSEQQDFMPALQRPPRDGQCRVVMWLLTG
jgi:hypothetical protein